MKNRLNSFKYAINGCLQAFRSEINLKIHVIISLVVISAGVFLDISMNSWLIIIGLIGFVIVVELINTAFEFMCDLITKEENKSIKIIKDISAGAVLIAAVTAAIIGTLTFLPYL